MKDLSKTKIIVTAVLIIPLIVLMILISTANKDAKIVSTGKLAIATVTRYSCDVIVNDVPQYKLDFEFLGDDGILHYGTTDSHYNEDFAKTVKQIEIKYDKNYRAVRADYKNEVSPITIILIPLSAVGVILFFSLIADIVRLNKEKTAKENGTTYIATYSSSHQAIIVNNVPYYKITYTYTNANGVIKTVKCKKRFTGREIEFFSRIQNFEIKEFKGTTVITENIDFNKINLIEKKKSLKYKKCTYCDSAVDKSVIKCPYCGSSDFYEPDEGIV